MKANVLCLGAAIALLAACAETRAPGSSSPEAREAKGLGPTGSPSRSEASVSPELRQKLVDLMSGYEHSPTAAEFAKLGPAREVEAALVELSRDGSIRANQRVFALTSLRFYPGPAARARMEEVLQDPAAPAAMRRPAVGAYAEGWRADAVPLLAKLAEHEDPHTRKAAVRALGEVGTPEARKVVEARAAAEPEPMVKSTAEEILRRWR